MPVWSAVIGCSNFSNQSECSKPVKHNFTRAILFIFAFWTGIKDVILKQSSFFFYRCRNKSNLSAKVHSMHRKWNVQQGSNKVEQHFMGHPCHLSLLNFCFQTTAQFYLQQINVKTYPSRLLGRIILTIFKLLSFSFQLNDLFANFRSVTLEMNNHIYLQDAISYLFSHAHED